MTAARSPYRHSSGWPVRALRWTAAVALAMCLGTPNPALAQQPAPCAGDEHRQFDFWIGEWEVTTPQGQRAGSNSIQSILGGCVLYESWEGATGSRGHSYNIYDRGRGVWHQSWVDNSGLLLQLDGALADGRMVLSGQTESATGTTHHRVTWSVEDDTGDVVRQFWQSSTDGGATWNVSFDGTYRRVGN